MIALVIWMVLQIIIAIVMLANDTHIEIKRLGYKGRLGAGSLIFQMTAYAIILLTL